MNYQQIELEEITIAYQNTGDEHSYRVEHEAAYALLDQILFQKYHLHLTDCNLEKGPHGKPYFTNQNIFFNVSHCKGMVACVVSDKRQVGIDVENVRAVRKNVVERIFSTDEKDALSKCEDEEQFFFQVWTYKESLVKMTGEGLTKELNQVSFLNPGNGLYQTTILCGEEKYVLSVSYRD